MNRDILYYLTIDQYEKWKEYEELLPLERRKKAFSHTQVDDRKRSFLGSLLLQTYTPTSVPLTYGSYGKPRKEGFPFSLSHSGNYVVLFVSDSWCGVDIETRKTIHPSLIDHVLSEEEKRWCFSDSDFISMWTRKESFAKCLGLGIFGFDGISKVPSEEGFFRFDGNGYVTRTVSLDGNILSLTKESDSFSDLFIKQADIKDLELESEPEWEILFRG